MSPPRAPSEFLQMAGETQIAALVREFRTTIAEHVGGLETRMSREIGKVATDAREARDAARDITATMTAQNVGAALEKLGGDVKAVESALRSDIVNQNARLKQEMTDCFEDVDERISDHERRLQAAERFASQSEGRNTVFGWMLRHLPGPILAAAGTFLAMLGLDKRL